MQHSGSEPPASFSAWTLHYGQSIVYRYQADNDLGAKIGSFVFVEDLSLHGKVERGTWPLETFVSAFTLLRKALEAIMNTKEGLCSREHEKTVSRVSCSALRTFRHLDNLWSLVALCVWPPPPATWLGIPASLRCWMLDTIFLLKGNPSSHPDSIILCLISSTTKLSCFAICWLRPKIPASLRFLDLTQYSFSTYLREIGTAKNR